MKMCYRPAASVASGEGALCSGLTSLCDVERISEYSYTLHCRAPSHNQIYFFFSEVSESTNWYLWRIFACFPLCGCPVIEHFQMGLKCIVFHPLLL